MAIKNVDKRWNFVRDKINISKDEFILRVLNSTYFSFDGQFYKNFTFMKSFSNNSRFNGEFGSKHQRLDFQPLFYFRYVNDVTMTVTKNLVDLRPLRDMTDENLFQNLPTIK